MASEITKRVSIYWDAPSGGEAGWVARCTEYDERGPVMGRIAMDEPVGDEETSEDAAREMAADYYGVDLDDVTVS